MNTQMKIIDSDLSFCCSKRAEFASTIFEKLRFLSLDGPGVSRESYGVGEQKAIDFLIQIAKNEGLIVSFDQAANLIIELPECGEQIPSIFCGSHLDSVPQGGNFDGAAGVIAGLISLIRLKRNGIKTKLPIKLIALRGEESAWFGPCYIGSNSLFGHLTEDDLNSKHRTTGKSLRNYMAKAGANIEKISKGEKLLKISDVAGYIELHIEQGPVMVARNVPVGIVTGLRGNIRYKKIRCLGEAGHSGAVPRWLRHDPVLATSELLHRVDEHWRVLLERGLDLVLTAGIFTTNPGKHAMSRIPGECEFSLEMRSQSIETLEAFDEFLKAEMRSIEREKGVCFNLSPKGLIKPAIMNQNWIEHLSSCCDTLDIEHERLPSGAGHDAAVFANNGIPSAMIFVRNQNGSHNPNEAMEISDFMQGAELLYESLLEPPF